MTENLKAKAKTIFENKLRNMLFQQLAESGKTEKELLQMFDLHITPIFENAEAEIQQLKKEKAELQELLTKRCREESLLSLQYADKMKQIEAAKNILNDSGSLKLYRIERVLVGETTKP